MFIRYFLRSDYSNTNMFLPHNLVNRILVGAQFLLFVLIFNMSFISNSHASRIKSILVDLPVGTNTSTTYQNAKGSFQKIEAQVPINGGPVVRSLTVKLVDENKEILKDFSPNNIKKMYAAYALKNAEKQNAASGILPRYMRGIFPGPLQFTQSSAAFFLAIGIIQFKDLMLNYAEHPAALFSHLEQQQDPISNIAFYMFMVGNQSTHKALVNLLSAHNLSKIAPTYINFIGMTMGMTLQNVSSEVLNPLKMCVKEINDRKQDINALLPTCEKAYADLVLADKLVDAVPDLVSMLLASAASGLLQEAVVTGVDAAGKTSAAEALKRASVVAGQWLKRKSSAIVGGTLTAVVPGGVMAWSGRFILETAVAEAFLTTQDAISPYVNPLIGNLQKGYSLTQLTDNILGDLIDLKSKNWTFAKNQCDQKFGTGAVGDYVAGPLGLPVEKEKCLREKQRESLLYTELKVFQKKMTDWRKFNLAEPIAATEAWGVKMNRVISMSEAAYKFYLRFIREIRSDHQNEEKYKQKLIDKLPISVFDFTAPYNGIVPLNTKSDEFDNNLYLDEPEKVQTYQSDRIFFKVLPLMEDRIRKGKFQVSALYIMYTDILMKLKKDYKSLIAFTNNSNFLIFDFQIFESVLKEKGKYQLSNGSVKKLEEYDKILKQSFADLHDLEDSNKKAKIIEKYNTLISQVTEDINSLPDSKENIKNFSIYYNILQQLKSKKVEDHLTAFATIRTIAEPRIGGVDYTYSQNLKSLVQEIVDVMGGMPNPIMVKGKNFIKAFELHKYYAPLMNDVQFPKHPGQYPLESLSEFLIFSMICGPSPANSNNNLLESHYGWQDIFSPPRIREEEDVILDFCNSASSEINNLNMYSNKLRVKNKSGEIIYYDGPIDYLRKRVRSELIQSKNNPVYYTDDEKTIKTKMKSQFEFWWDNNVSPQIAILMSSYEKDFNKIFRMFMKAATTVESAKDKNTSAEDFNKNRVSTNIGPMSNSAVHSMLQEMRLYLLIMNELLRDTLVPKLAYAIDSLEIDYQKRVTSLSPSLEQSKPLYFPLMQYLMVKQPFDLATIVKAQPMFADKLPFSENSATYKMIDEIHEQFNETAQLFINIGTDYDLKERMANINSFKKSSGELNKLLNKNRKTLEAGYNLYPNFTESHRKILNLCLDGLVNLSQELEGYGLAVMAVQKNKLDEVDKDIWEK